MTTQEILEAARGAKAALALADSASRAQALHSMAAQLCSPANMTAILAANADDMAAAKGHISEVMLDRLALTEERIRAMAKGIEEVAALPDPVGRVLKRVERPNGNFIDDPCYVIVPNNTSCYFNIFNSCIVFDNTCYWGYSICPR